MGVAAEEARTSSEIGRGNVMTLEEAAEQLRAVPDFEKVRMWEDTVGFLYRGRGHSVTKSFVATLESMEAFIDFVQVSELEGGREVKFAADGSPIAVRLYLGGSNKKD